MVGFLIIFMEVSFDLHFLLPLVQNISPLAICRLLSVLYCFHLLGTVVFWTHDLPYYNVDARNLVGPVPRGSTKLTSVIGSNFLESILSRRFPVLG